MYRIVTHDNSKKYFENLSIKADTLYVTPNTTLTFALLENSSVNKEDSWRVIDIDNLIKLVHSNTDDLLIKIKLKTAVRLIINNLKEVVKDERILKELIYLEDNISILMSDIIYFLEINLKNFNYKIDNITKKTFKLIYDELLKTEIYKGITKNILSNDLLSNFYKNIKGYNGKIIKKIYFYNINNLDLKRWLIIEYLNKAGFEIVFKIPYFHGLNVTNKSWDMVYGDKEIFNWNYVIENSDRRYLDSKYINYLEGYTNYIDRDEKVITKTYYEVSDFRKILHNRRVVTFYKNSLGTCKDSIIFENEDSLGNIDHCYQTSIGRFLLNLYSLKIKDNIIKIDFNLYRELITSGWIDIKGWNGIRLSEYLSVNESYFNGVSNMDEILQRLNTLKDLEEVNDIFENQAKSQIKDSNQKKLLVNPFRAFGYNNLEEYGITATYMINLTIRLKNLILKAFESDNGLINIEKHFGLLKLAFRNKYIVDKSKSGSEIEKLIIRRIWSVLNNTKNLPSILYYEDIADFFSISLKINKDKVDNEESDFSIDHLEGLIYRDRMVDYNGKKIVYISDLSYKAYEKYRKNKYLLGKILTEDDFNDIFTESFSGMHKSIILRGLKLKKASLEATESYLKFIFANLFINFDGIKEISWIEGLRNDDSKSIILKQIETIYDNREEEDQYLNDKDMLNEEDILIDKYIEYDKKELCKNNLRYSEVSYRDLDFCNNKFLYSSILNDYPMYYSDFHNKLAFSALVSVLKNSINESYLNISKFIFPLFPQWEDVVKQNILTCEYGRKNIREYKYFDGINYPKTIDSLYLLKSKYVVGENWKIKNRYNKGNFKQEEYYMSFISYYIKDDIYNRGKHCSMCPHIYLCKKGEFIIDNR